MIEAPLFGYPHECETLGWALRDEIAPVGYSPRLREYSIELKDGSVVLMTHCPFCGAVFPDSLRVIWFRVLEIMGVEHTLGQEEQIPLAFLTDAWWNEVDDEE